MFCCCDGESDSDGDDVGDDEDSDTSGDNTVYIYYYRSNYDKTYKYSELLKNCFENQPLPESTDLPSVSTRSLYPILLVCSLFVFILLRFSLYSISPYTPPPFTQRRLVAFPRPVMRGSKAVISWARPFQR